LGERGKGRNGAIPRAPSKKKGREKRENNLLPINGKKGIRRGKKRKKPAPPACPEKRGKKKGGGEKCGHRGWRKGPSKKREPISWSFHAIHSEGKKEKGGKKLLSVTGRKWKKEKKKRGSVGTSPLVKGGGGKKGSSLAPKTSRKKGKKKTAADLDFPFPQRGEKTKKGQEISGNKGAGQGEGEEIASSNFFEEEKKKDCLLREGGGGKRKKKRFPRPLGSQKEKKESLGLQIKSGGEQKKGKKGGHVIKPRVRLSNPGVLGKNKKGGARKKRPNQFFP